MSTKKKALQAAAGNAGEPIFSDDVFSTYLYTGNDSIRTITNGIDLAGEGGLVWIKSRSSTREHSLYDTVRGVEKLLKTNSTGVEQNTSGGLTAFNSDGFSLGAYADIHGSAYGDFASWTFRKAPKFFDVVTWTGDGTTGTRLTINHNLGTVPGCIIIKNTNNATDNWYVYHRGIGDTLGLFLNLTNAAGGSGVFNESEMTSSSFTVPHTAWYNTLGETWVAYLFAHNNNDGGFGENADQDIIKCGSYTGNGSVAGPSINVGFEPQYVMIKAASGGTGSWYIFDNMRGIVSGGGGNDATLQADSSLDEALLAGSSHLSLTPNGFDLTSTSGGTNGSSVTYIYIAIRRPHKPAETGSEVFAVDTRSATNPAFISNFPVDGWLYRDKTGSDWYLQPRLTQKHMLTNSSAAEGAGSLGSMDSSIGVLNNGTVDLPNIFSWMFKRSPGFFDVVAYTGLVPHDQNTTQSVSHNLGVAPELIITKNRSSAFNWAVCTFINGTYSNRGYLNTNASFGFSNNLQPGFNGLITDSALTFGYGDNVTNASPNNYIAYLFASKPGISKVGSYTGNGTSQTIDCGFTTGARFVLIKRTDSAGDWHVWDSVRGIVAGNDPYLELNTTNAEVTTADSVDPVSSGFVVNEEASAAINTNAATYIYLAIA